MPIKHTPRVRRIVNLLALASALIGLSTLLIVFGTIMYQRYFGGLSCEEWYAQEVRPNSFRSVALEVVQEGEETWLMIDHNIPYRIRLCDCEVDCPIRSFLSPGDSVIKEKGSLDLLLIQMPVGRRQTVAYPCCE
jgi:hypothetical protein